MSVEETMRGVADITRGIDVVDPADQVVIANYRPQAEPDEGIHVVEMANGRAEHMGGKILVFGRWITQQERDRRIEAYQADPEQYNLDHLKSLSH